MFILSHELAQRSSLKIYLVLLCTRRNIHNHRNQDLFESSSSCFAVFSHNAVICWRGGIKAAALSFKRNLRILGFPVRKWITREPTLVCGSGSSDLPTAQKLCRSSWEWMKKVQRRYTGNGFKHNANFSPLTNFSFLIKSAGHLPLCDSHHAPSYEHAGDSQTGILVAALQKLWRFSRTRLKLVW